MNDIVAHYRRKRMPNTEELEALPVLCQGQADDLHIDTGDIRIWLSRCSIEDGEPFVHTVHVELEQDGSWINAGSYDGDNPPTFGPGWSWRMLVGEF